MKYTAILLFIAIVISCTTPTNLYLTKPFVQVNKMSGSQFYNQVLQYNWQQRDSLATIEILNGNYPDFLRSFVPIKSTFTDSLGKTNTAIFYVAPDYLCIGTNTNWARVPLTPMAAQKIADSVDCFLPTKKMVDLIYEQATLKLEPQPLTQNRDSSITMYQHHLLIEEQRKNRKGLIAGIKKDIVLTQQLLAANKTNKVAIYGWHKLNAQPIQPVYTGHINWYVDYSHGVRLIARKIKINGVFMDYKKVLSDPILSKLICDEANCSFLGYNY